MNELPIGELLSGLAVLFSLIVLNAFFVVSEYSLVVSLSRRTRLVEMADRGSAPARLVLRVMDDSDRYFAAVQMGVTLTSVAIGSFAEEPLSNFFQQLFGLVDSPALRGVALQRAASLVLAWPLFSRLCWPSWCRARWCCGWPSGWRWCACRR